MPKGQVGGGKRRSTKGLPTVPRSYIEGLIEKVEQFYSQRDKGTEWYNHMAKLRLKSIIALLYLSGRRLSELTGRVYHYGDGRWDDVCEGVKLKDFWEATVKGRPVLCMHYRVLKKGSFEKGLKEEYSVANIRLDDLLVKHVQAWLDYLRRTYHTDNTQVFHFTRGRTYQLVTEVEPKVWLHWFHHERLTHLAEVMDPYSLKEFAEWESIEPASNYVHRALGRILDAVEQADKPAGLKKK